VCHNGTIICHKRNRQMKVLCLCDICMAEEPIEWRAAASIFSPPPHAQGTQDAWWRGVWLVGGVLGKTDLHPMSNRPRFYVKETHVLCKL